MPYCPKCGTELRPNVKFCHKCGTEVRAPTVPEGETYMKEKMTVREATPSIKRALIGIMLAMLGIPVGFAVIIYMYDVLGWTRNLPVAITIPLSLSILIGLPIMWSILFVFVVRARERKITVTPLLIVDEKGTAIDPRYARGLLLSLVGANFLALIWSLIFFDFSRFLTALGILLFLPVLYYAWFLRRKKFALCEEGVVKGRYLYRWGLFSSFTTDDSGKQFKLKKGWRTILELLSRENFDEVKRILSEHISSSGQ